MDDGFITFIICLSLRTFASFAVKAFDFMQYHQSG
jgi:hypothetical protein